jgi:hypothetical protein
MRYINFLSYGPNDSSKWFRHVETAEEANGFTHDLFSSGDYHGSHVEAANRKVLLENTELCERLGIEELSEMFHSDTLLFPIAALNDPELKEIFESLEDYPCLDDEAMSEVERDLEKECWDSFGQDDFEDHLRDTLDDSLTDKIENLTNEQIDSIYYSATRETNYNIFQVESGTSGYFNFESFGGLYKDQIPLLTKLVSEIK